jgi:hypothetical protein
VAAVLCGRIDVTHARLVAGTDQTLGGAGAPGFDGKIDLYLAGDKGRPRLSWN